MYCWCQWWPALISPVLIWHWCFISFAFCHYLLFVSLAGAFVGCALNGSVVSTRDSVNARFYGGPIKASEILLGSLPKPPAAATLYKALSVLFDKIEKWISWSFSLVCDTQGSMVNWIIYGSLVRSIYLILVGDDASVHLTIHCFPSNWGIWNHKPLCKFCRQFSLEMKRKPFFQLLSKFFSLVRSLGSMVLGSVYSGSKVQWIGGLRSSFVVFDWDKPEESGLKKENIFLICWITPLSKNYRTFEPICLRKKNKVFLLETEMEPLFN